MILHLDKRGSHLVTPSAATLDWHNNHGPKEFGCFRSGARSGQESLAQGSPWVIPLVRIGPEWATRYGENPLRTFEPDCVRISSPFRAKRLFWLTQGKPWAMLSCPFGADPSGRIPTLKIGFNPGEETPAFAP
jgi:hypothetical protein